MKIDLGGGRAPKKGFTNVDKWEDHFDVYCDFNNDLLPFEDESIEEINSHHMLEHLEINSVPKIIDECYRVLKPGGKFHVVIPDMETACKDYLGGRKDQARMMIFGGNTDNPFDIHRCGFDTEELTGFLKSSGFKILSTEYPDWYGINIDIWCKK